MSTKLLIFVKKRAEKNKVKHGYPPKKMGSSWVTLYVFPLPITPVLHGLLINQCNFLLNCVVLIV